MDGHCLSPYTFKFCAVFKQFDGLNFDSLAGKHQKCQNFPRQNFPFLDAGEVLLPTKNFPFLPSCIQTMQPCAPKQPTLYMQNSHM